MSYATHDDLVSRFGADEILQLADRDRDGAEDSGVVDQALADADAEIDAYLVVLYALPLTTVPPLLVRLACDIARYRLYGDRALDEVRTRYTDGIAFLKLVAAGTAKLGVDPAPAASEEDPQPLYGAADRVFSRDTLGDY